MPRAYYINYVPDDTFDLPDKTGGIPTWVPPQIPEDPDFGGEMALVLQFACHPQRLPIPDAKALLIYQSAFVDQGVPDPQLVLVPHEAPVNTIRKGRIHPWVTPCRIDWEEREEPDEIPDDLPWEPQPEISAMYRPKLGGAAPYTLPGCRFLGWIFTELGTPNIGFGATMLLFLREDGEIVIDYMSG